MSLITNIFGREARFHLEQIARDTVPALQTPEGREEVVKSILYSELPIRLSEYVFEIKEGKCISLLDCSDERIEFLKKLFEKGVTKEMVQQYTRYSTSASALHSSNRNSIFHTHPRYSPEVYASKDEPLFSKADKKFSRKEALGLVEYCIAEDNKDSIQLSSRLSLCYKHRVRKLLEMEIVLNPDGSYASNDGEIEHSGIVPILASLTENLFEQMIKVAARDKLMKYTLQHAVQRLGNNSLEI